MFDLDQDTAFTQRVLDALSLRSKAVLHNLANKNTPGYKRYYVKFEDELREARNRGTDIAEVRPRLMRDESGDLGENNVSEFEEIALLEKVRALHEIFTRRAGGYFSKINKAIRGRP